MRNIKIAVYTLSLCILCTPALGAYKCTDNSGRVSSSDVPCPVGNQLESTHMETGTGADNNHGEGTVTKEWSEYCVVTFVSNELVNDISSGAKFEAKAGTSYLTENFFGEVDGNKVQSASILYLIPSKGIVSFSTNDFDNKPLEATSNCKGWGEDTFLTVFADVVLYTDEELHTEACKLTAGTSIQLSNTSSIGVGDTRIRLELSGSDKLCNSYQKVYFPPNKVDIGGVSANAKPIWTIKQKTP